MSAFDPKQTLNRRQYRQPCFLRTAPAALEAAPQLRTRPGAAEHCGFVSIDGSGRSARPAFDLEPGAEANEVGRRADVIGRHSPRLAS